jgi:hypothetical protein
LAEGEGEGEEVGEWEGELLFIHSSLSKFPPRPNQGLQPLVSKAASKE